MARRLREEVPGGIYHVTARAVHRERVFRERGDCRRFLALLEDVVGRHGWLCYAYCLMGTHYHLLVRTPAPDLAVGLHRLNGAYAQWFNRRHGRRGHLFGDRYGSTLVERERHLLEAARYVVLNPVRAGLCGSPAAWRWSSYAATAGILPEPGFLAVDALLASFGAARRSAELRYRRFVHDVGAPPRRRGPAVRPEA
jgi:REP element-mobilizing transposase RayT